MIQTGRLWLQYGPNESQDSSLSIVTRPQVGKVKNWGSSVGTGRDFALTHHMQPASGPGQPHISTVKRLISKSRHSTLPTAKVRKVWRSASIPPYISLICCLIM